MKTKDINLKKDNFNFSCKSFPAKSHYKFIMTLGRAFPITKAQARYFVSENISLDVLNADDVEKVEFMLNKHGFEGNYKWTKSKTWVRLVNQSDLHESFKKEFNL